VPALNLALDLSLGLSTCRCSGTAMTAVGIRLVFLWCCWCGLASADAATMQSDDRRPASGPNWERLLAEAERLHLPTKFLRALPREFVRFEFDDLRTYAAEYHPGDHRLILNRTLSFNAAGGTLKPLARMTHKELDLLYHELFHAYMDYLVSPDGPSTEVDGGSGSLMNFARIQRRCRYTEVRITPVVQRNAETELRYLTEEESWEALNETWAVFIGWAVWNQLEVEQGSERTILRHPDQMKRWARRLDLAFQNGDFRGYYVPEDPDERRTTQKRVLAQQSQLTWGEAAELMTQVLGFPEELVSDLGRRPGFPRSGVTESSCRISKR